ncbi:MAG: MBL fold metallo-hydrolase [Anaerolineae bacterium]|nr:MBL fold metallo-hydrolase [Anaerolineae bacterium]MDW8098297.1 MBL fold metallo-hydrolase [Anaerolineae bacterium]
MACRRLKVGRALVHIVDDGQMWMDAGGMFGVVPKRLWSQITTADAENRVPLALRCLLIESQGRRILVDTGYGDKLTPRVREILGFEPDDRDRLLRSLGAAGFGPDDVDIVLNTHLHGDHCGGNTRWTDGPGSPVIPTFPRAVYWVQRLELADASFPNERTRGAYFAENFQPLQQANRLHMIDGDVWLTDEVHTWITPGHTRAHQCVVIESEREAAIFLADAAPWAVNLERLAWVPAYDIEPLVSIQTKKQIIAWAAHHRAWLIFQHDPRIDVGHLAPADEGWQVVPLD